MIMQKVMEKRRSVREYKNKELDIADLESLRALMDHASHILSSVQVRFHMVRDGELAFKTLSGVAGYNGVMIEAPHYLVILSDNHEDRYKAAGYLTEWLVLNLTKRNIGTCWIDTNNKADQIKKTLNLDTPDEIIGLMAIGYAAMDTRLSNIFDTKGMGTVTTVSSIGYPHVEISFAPEPVSARLSICDLVYLNEWGVTMTVEELELRGLAEVFFYMRLAPSWGNQQPWRFILKGNQILLTVMNEYGAYDQHVAEIDAGIAMLYFETAMHSEGLPGSWNFAQVENSADIPQNHRIVGVYTY